MNDIDTIGIEFFKNVTDAVYAVIAKKDGLVLSMRPGVSLHKHSVTVFYLKVRVHKEEEWANLESSKELFGFQELDDRGPNYKTMPIYVPLLVGPANSVTITDILAKGDVVRKALEVFYKRIHEAGIKNPASMDNVKLYCESVLADQLPVPNIKIATDFPVLVGVESIKNRIMSKL